MPGSQLPNGTYGHTPDPRPGPPPQTKTADYDATVDPALDVAYVVEGATVHRVYDWLPTAGRYGGSTGGIWRRDYFPADPPTVPESGTYKVYEGDLLRETGKYARKV